jgi:acyl-CoA synthetase (AMP-forming)/AMP-acid ligase II
MPGTEGKIVDPTTDSDLPPTSTGELLIRGPQIMMGYLDNPEATRKTIDEDGWLHTGDIAHFNDQGCLFTTDRCKELIKYKGFQISPAELEAVIVSMEQVQDAIVIPVPDEIAGELPRAYVVPIVKQPQQKQGEGPLLRGKHKLLTEKDVVDFVAQRVAPHKKLRGGVKFTDKIPKSLSGKLLRRRQIQLDRENSSST